MSSLTVTGVSKSFPPTSSGRGGDVLAVDDVTLEVPHGSLTAVLGPSGCGKTTLLRLIAGFLTPDAGTIAFDGHVVAGRGRAATPQQRKVGYVPQEGALFPHLDVAANIGFGLGRSERGGARVDEVLDLVELPRSLRTRAPHELSGGQQQRVALARALAPRPSVVLLDEPFSSLDASLRESTGRAVARALRAEHATGLLVTHDQSEALSLSDQVAVLREGRLIQAGPPADVYLAPHDTELARFVGGAAAVAARAEPDGLAATSVLGRVTLTRRATADDLVLVVRPDQLRIGDATGAPARVDEVSFYGHDAAVRLTLLESDTALVARVIGPGAPTAGDQVRVTVQGAVHACPAPAVEQSPRRA